MEHADNGPTSSGRHLDAVLDIPDHDEVMRAVNTSHAQGCTGETQPRPDAH